MKRVLTADAWEDLARALEWTVENRPAGEASNLLSAIRAAVEHIGQFPESSSRFYLDYRKHILAHLPYALIYFVKDRSPVVVVVTHTSRDPEWWKPRTKK